MSEILDTYIDIESERVVSHVVNKSIKEMGNLSVKDYLNFSEDSVTYNLVNINKFRNDLSEKIQNNFFAIEHGDFSGYPLYMQYNRNKYKYVEYGYLCEVNFNSIRNSALFANVGPNIPIKLSFIGNTKVDMDVKIDEYGINNVIVQVFAVVEVSNQVTMPISSKNYNIKVNEPIAIDIIKGSVPNYYSNFS